MAHKHFLMNQKEKPGGDMPAWASFSPAMNSTEKEKVLKIH